MRRSESSISRYFPRSWVSFIALSIGASACHSESKKAVEPKDAPAIPQAESAPRKSSLEKTSTKDPAGDKRAPDSREGDAAKGDATTAEPTRSNTVPTDVPRVYAKTRHVWIRSMPQSDVQWIGYLWWGDAVKIRGATRVPGAGCKKEWVPIEPRGWVCVDDEQATLDPKDPEFVAIFPHRPNVDSPWPHRYANVHEPVRRYNSLPSKDQQKSWEVGYERHMENVEKARAGKTSDLPPTLAKTLDPSLSGKAPPPFPTLPSGLTEDQPRIAARSAISYVTEVDFDGRAFLLTGDLAWVPKDRVDPVERSDFQGIELGKGFELPVAFFRGKKRPGFRQQGDGSFDEVPEQFERLSVVQLEGDPVSVGLTKYYKVKGRELWVSSREAVIPTPREKTPWGASVGQPDTVGSGRQGRSTWLEASILGGWLVAFEGTRAVYATMISAGRGGTPVGDRDPLETASTPTGRFPIGGKFRTATMMSSSTPIVHTDVPWTQNFSGPHAIHSAYWHDDWGSLKSAGCVNVSPKDGKWLFEFTEPTVPEDWYGVRYMARYGDGSTLLIVHE